MSLRAFVLSRRRDFQAEAQGLFKVDGGLVAGTTDLSDNVVKFHTYIEGGGRYAMVLGFDRDDNGLTAARSRPIPPVRHWELPDSR